MAKETKTTNGIPINPVGMNDNIPLELETNFYLTRGLFSIHDRSLQRCNGKFLRHKFPTPILAIHGDLRERVFIETTNALYMFISLDDDIPI